MKKLIIAIVVAILIVLSFALGFYFKGNVTGRAISEEEYSFTKAICEGNKCVDVKITCSGDSVKGIELISDVQEFSPSWVDIRTEEEKNKLCG